MRPMNPIPISPPVPEAPFEIGDWLTYHGHPFMRQDDGNFYDQSTWKSVEPGDFARVIRAEAGYADFIDGEWRVANDWNVARFPNGLEVAIDVESKSSWRLRS